MAWAGQAPQTSRGRAALSELCGLYWYPLYAHCRRLGHSTEDAADVTQAFFVSLLERHDLAGLQQERGRFRTFLLAALRHFVSNRRVHDQALKRGGGQPLVSLDVECGESRYAREPTDPETPETAFDRRWAMTLLDQVMHTVQTEWAAAGKQHAFYLLSPSLSGDLPRGAYADIAVELESNEPAVRKAAERLRRQFHQELRLAIGDTVLPEDVDDELRFLLRVLQR